MIKLMNVGSDIIYVAIMKKMVKKAAAGLICSKMAFRGHKEGILL